MLTWNDFYEALKFEMNKGDLYDTLRQSKTFQALRMFEQNWTYQYMDQQAILTVHPGQREVTLPPGIKTLRCVKLNGVNLEELNPHKFMPGGNGTPTGYVKQGDCKIWLDNAPDEEIKLWVFYELFTLRHQLDPQAGHPMLEHGWAPLLGQVMKLMAPTAREPAWIELYGPQVEEGIHTLHVWDEEERMRNSTVVFGSGNSEESSGSQSQSESD